MARLRAVSWRRRAALIAIASAALAAGYFGWLRDSSLVAVHDVEVEGVGGADREQIVEALTDAARGMTTLHVRSDRLEGAVQGFPTIASVSADPSFPHGLTVHVTQRRPVLVARSADRQLPVAADGTLLPGLEVDGEDLPELQVDSLADSGRLSGDPLEQAVVIGAAPAPLRSLVAKTSVSRDYGVELTMRGGIALRFGDADRADAKWAAVAAILADPKLTSVAYLDVRVPERPAVGGAPAPAVEPATSAVTTPP